jgi:hypothetical protein
MHCEFEKLLVENGEVAMAVWMIHIIPRAKPGDPATFEPQLQQPGPNGEAYASVGDLVNWFNRTAEPYQPEATDSTFQNPLNAPPGSAYYLSEQIPPNQPSRSSWRAVAPASGNVLYYRCALHHDAHGMIIITQ